MKSFFDDVPKDVDEAAMIDGATRWQVFWKVVLPMVKGGVAACAVLCFVFAWTEFLISLMLTTDIRTVPVKIRPSSHPPAMNGDISRRSAWPA
jgi:multiple sugar transport system permease protein